MSLEDELQPVFSALSEGKSAQVQALARNLLAQTPNDPRGALLLLFSLCWDGTLLRAQEESLDNLFTKEDKPYPASSTAAIHLFRTHLLQKRRLVALNDLAEFLISHINTSIERIDFTAELFNRAGNEQRVDELNQLADEILNKRCQTQKDSRYLDASELYGIVGEMALSFGCLTLLEKLELSQFPAPKIYAQPDASVANLCFLDYWRDHLEFAENPEEMEELPDETHKQAWRFCSWKLPDGSVRHHDDVLTYALCRWENLGNPPLFSLKSEHRDRGNETIQKLGLPKDAWHVCLHVREQGYHNDHTDLVSSDRNVKIESFFPAIEAITKRGGWVVRMGDRSMSPLPPMEGVIDYPFSEHKSDWMDVYLTATSRFLLGTASGLFLIPTFFGVPNIITNQTPISQRPYSSKDLFIFKRYRDMRDGKIIPLADSCTMPLRGTKNAPFLRGIEVDVIDNTAEEIGDVTLEMLDTLDGKQQTDKEATNLRQQLNQLTGHDFGFPVPQVGASFIKSVADLF